MRAAVVPDAKSMIRKLEQHGFRAVRQRPDFVLCHGGDGTILVAERLYPGVPKLSIKHTTICHMCEVRDSRLDRALDAIRDGDFKIEKQMKLQVRAEGKRLVGLNEIQIHTKLPTRAVRFSLRADGKHFDNLIGDGVIVATPFGSTAYYQSAGGRPFAKGMGVSFNNLHPRPVRSFVLPESARIKIKIERGPAYLITDNDENFITLDAGDTAAVSADGVARFIRLKP